MSLYFNIESNEFGITSTPQERGKKTGKFYDKMAGFWRIVWGSGAVNDINPEIRDQVFERLQSLGNEVVGYFTLSDEEKQSQPNPLLFDLFQDFIADTHGGLYLTGSETIEEGQANMTMHVLSLLKERIPDLAGKKLVDLACGTGGWPIVAAAAGMEVVGINMSDKQLEIAQRKAEAMSLVERTHFIKADAENTQLGNFVPDAVTWVENLFHMDRAASLKNMAEQLPSGAAIVLTDSDFGGGGAMEFMMKQFFNVNSFMPREEYTALLEEMGFKDVKITDLDSCMEPLMAKTKERMNERKDDLIKELGLPTYLAMTVFWDWMAKEYTKNWGYYSVSAVKA